MLRYIAGVLVLIGLVLVLLYFFVGVPRVYEEEIILSESLHLYGDPDQSIEKIDVVAFYFVPNNKKVQITNWRQVLATHLDRLKVFHEAHFLGRSSLTYQIYPTPIDGYEDSSVYDTEVTQHGNPEALKRITAELQERVFNQKGDKYRGDIVAESKDSYRVLFIMYEGVGATGSENVALLARVFLTGEEYQPFATTFLAHEFYHTLGVPDSYTRSKKVFEDGQTTFVEIITSGDLMGRVRVPIENTYLDRRTLTKFGF